jgi:hypothetical protein
VLVALSSAPSASLPALLRLPLIDQADCHSRGERPARARGVARRRLVSRSRTRVDRADMTGSLWGVRADAMHAANVTGAFVVHGAISLMMCRIDVDRGGIAVTR